MGEIVGIARFKFHEGKVEEYKRLSAEAMEIVRTKDSGTLQFDTYFNDDESECMVIERYRDSAAAIEHWENLRDLSETILAMVSVVHGELLGDVSAELRANLAGSPVQLFASVPVDVDTDRRAGRGCGFRFSASGFRTCPRRSSGRCSTACTWGSRSSPVSMRT